MNIIAKVALGTALSVGLAYASTQPEVRSKPPADAPLRPVPESSAIQPKAPMYELSAKWNERMSVDVMSVPLKNESDRPLEVLGVQATRGIFIGDFPDKIAPGKEDLLSLVYVASDNTDGDIELIRVYTDQGIKEILIKVDREAAVNFDTRELSWVVGEDATPKVALLSVVSNTVVPQGVRVTGGHRAVLENAGEGRWRVRVTPDSTAKSGRFAVFVDFDKPLPGMAPVILGAIRPKE